MHLRILCFKKITSSFLGQTELSIRTTEKQKVKYLQIELPKENLSRHLLDVEANEIAPNIQTTGRLNLFLGMNLGT
jgi:hypothetical protein